MLLPRVIPSLLLRRGGLVKTVKFKNPSYVGDPINAVKIFNDKEVDELVILDIFASRDRTPPDFTLLRDIASQAFMPMAYGGGVRNIADIKKLLSIGYEKVILNSAAIENPKLVTEAAEHAGSQAVVASIDVKKSMLGKYEVHTRCGSKATGMSPERAAQKLAGLGAGEILLNSIDRDGTMSGYDLSLIQRVASSLNIPIVALGGAGKLEDLKTAIETGGASAVSAGSLFVFHGKLKAVLISYPSRQNLEDLFHKP